MESSLDSYSSIKDVTYRFDAYSSTPSPLPVLEFLIRGKFCFVLIDSLRELSSSVLCGCAEKFSTKELSCGYCGYALNLSSSARNTAGIGSKYGKQIKKGVVSFVAVDESRFTLTDEVTCTPYFRSGRSWGFLRRRSRLLCRKCGGRIGNAYEEDDGRDPCGLSDGDGFSDDMRASSGSGGSGSSASSHMNYLIKISALQPSSDDSYALL